jgi:hypothetical protein
VTMTNSSVVLRLITCRNIERFRELKFYISIVIMSEITSHQCEAFKTGTHIRCRNQTKRGKFCVAHQARDLGIKVTKSKIPAAGLGLVTVVPRKKGDKITDYTGKVTRVEPPGNGRYVLQTAKNHFIDAENPLSSGYGRWINDARPENRPLVNNSAFAIDNRTKKVAVKATKNIPANKEVFLPYGRAYWSAVKRLAKNGAKQAIKTG